MTRTHILVLAGALLLLPLTAQAAHADHVGWSFGAGFHVGNAYFSLGFGAHAGYAPGYYYRTSGRVYAQGHHCSDRCFRDGGIVYHAASCPLVRAYFDHYGVQPAFLFERFAPAPLWRGRYYRDVTPWAPDRYYRRDDRYNRYDRYDRYDRQRRYDRYRDRRDRSDERWRDRRGRSDHRDHYNRRDRDDWRDRSSRSHRRHDHSRGHGNDR
jgi:hypothetical protein